jgi:hypothetical protein
MKIMEIKQERIIVIPFEDPKTKKLMVSHGVGEETLRTYVLPQVPISEIGALFDRDLDEYILE